MYNGKRRCHTVAVKSNPRRESVKGGMLDDKKRPILLYDADYSVDYCPEGIRIAANSSPG